MQSGAPFGPWQHERVRTTAQMTPVIEKILSLMQAAGFPERDLFGMRLSLEEAIVNGIVHGNAKDPDKSVHVRYQLQPDQVIVEVEDEDEGPGFKPEQVPDPLAPENLERPSGRGVFLIRHYMTWVKFNDRGNRLTLGKSKSA
ncbi:MAG: ATP-binding protein [Planctomycetes bacterium]|nr:ATP-binding protein [Planctomycetota bacterium]